MASGHVSMKYGFQVRWIFQFSFMHNIMNILG